MSAFFHGNGREQEQQLELELELGGIKVGERDASKL